MEMRKKIIRSFMFTFLISFLIGFTILFGIMYMVFLNTQQTRQFDQLRIIENMNEVEKKDVGTYLEKLDSRLTVIDEDGQVLYDNIVDTIDENHLERSEVKQALSQTQGSAVRKSDTTNIDYLYTAIYDKTSHIIVRLATPFDGIAQSSFALLPSFIMAFLIALVTVWFISKRMASTIILPLQEISQKIWTTRIGKEKIRFEMYQYPELYEITEAIESMNEEISENISQLEKEKKIRQEFFSNASHELKTPLTSIIGYTELLKTNTITDKEQKQRCLDLIMKESQHMKQLVEDILTISKLESEEYKASLSHVSIPELLNAVLDRFQVSMETMGLIVDVQCDPLLVYADKRHIEGLFENLISNAVKYNVQGGKISIACYGANQDMIFKIQDTGIGISKEDQERVFQRFYRVDKQRSKVISGTGLGLAIVKHIVQYYDGSIKLESEEKKGTAITLSLPVLVKDH